MTMDLAEYTLWMKNGKMNFIHELWWQLMLMKMMLDDDTWTFFTNDKLM